MPRLNIERQKELEPKRLNDTKKIIEDLGFEVDVISPISFNFKYKGETVYFYPYSGWHSGKSIKDGRGFKKLLNQIKQ